MKTSNTLLAFNRVDHSDTTTMLIQSGYISLEASGFYSLTTLGTLALRRLERSVERALEDAGAGQVLLSSLQSQDELWSVTGRDLAYGEELMSVQLRSGQLMRLSATAEEQITRLGARYLQGKSVNHWWYQISNKWRDETRARAGLVRAREFRMLDSYAVHTTQEGALLQYEKARDVLMSCLTHWGLNVRVVDADCGEIGGSKSQEIQVETDIDGHQWLEVGHCFMLGSTYTDAFKWSHQGQSLHMSCHGLGTTRVLAVLLHHMRKGSQLLGSSSFAVADAVVVCWDKDQQVQQRAQEVYQTLRQSLDVIWEDRFTHAGQALTASEMLGAQHRIVVSSRHQKDQVEWTHWETSQTQLIDTIQLLDRLC